MKNPGKPGWKDQDYHEAVESLAAAWKNYTNKEPTLHNKNYEVDEYQNSQKTCGPFLDYLNISIKSAIRYANKNRKKKISSSVSLANIARDVIRNRKESIKSPCFVELARKGHLAAPRNDPQFKQDADKISEKLHKKESQKVYKSPDLLEAARRGHLAAPKNDPHWKEEADKVSKKLGHMK